jgi:DNA primase
VPSVCISDLDAPTHLVIDIDPPEGAPFTAAVAAAHLVRHVLDELELPAAVKTSGAKGLHVVVPIECASSEDAAVATRAIAARAERLDPQQATTAFLKEDRSGRVFIDATRSGLGTVVAVYSPRLRPGVPVSWPLGWDELEAFAPGDVTITNALPLLGDREPWGEMLGAPARLADSLVEEGRMIPIPRIAAMHEGKRRARKPSDTT